MYLVQEEEKLNHHQCPLYFLRRPVFLNQRGLEVVVSSQPVQPLAAPQPLQKRRPGRPPKNKECTTFLDTEISYECSVVLTSPPSTPPPTKRRPGRPRKV
jgi:hypothetical protein